MKLINKKEYIINNTTVLVTGHNIKYFALLSIESLLSVSKFKREQIVYFDDFSTDGTIEELEKRNIKCITWKNNEYDNFIKNNNMREYINIRLSAILNSAYKQINSKYIFVIDGDNVFFQDPTEFIFDYLVPYNSDEDAIFFGFKYTDFPNGEYSCKQFYCGENEKLSYISRNFMYFNKEELEKNGCFPETLEEINLLCNNRDTLVSVSNFKTGTILYSKLKQIIDKISIIDTWMSPIDEAFFDNYVTHIGAISSATRNSLTSGVIKENIDERLIINNVCLLKELYEKIGFTHDDLIKSFNENYNKSNPF